MTMPAFTGAKVIAALILEAGRTGRRETSLFQLPVGGVVCRPLSEGRQRIETEDSADGLMKPMPVLDALLTRAVKLGVFGTKMRSVINLSLKEGTAFETGTVRR